MNSKIEKAKQNLINLMCDEAKKIIDSHKSLYSKIGWVDYIDNNLVQYQFTCAYVSMNDEIILVEKENCESKTNLKMHEVKNIERLEWILKGLIQTN